MSTFLLGIAAGIALHRLIMAIVLGCDPDRTVSYCAWCHQKDCPRMKLGQFK